jgi:hypothetical protein
MNFAFFCAALATKNQLRLFFNFLVQSQFFHKKNSLDLLLLLLDLLPLLLDLLLLLLDLLLLLLDLLLC